MMRSFLSLAAIFAAGPAFASEGAYISLHNTQFIVILGFILFIAVLTYYKVPSMTLGLLDKRAQGIRSDLDEARALREEAQSLLASYERQQTKVQEQADRITRDAKADAKAAAAQAKADLQKTIERRMLAAEEQLASAEKKAVREVQDRAAAIAVAAARDVIAAKTSKADGSKLIDESIAAVGAKLH